MNERGFSGHHRSSLDWFPSSIFDLRFRPFLLLSLSLSLWPHSGYLSVCGRAPTSPPGPLQFGRLRSPENGAFSIPRARRSHSRHEKFQVITLIILQWFRRPLGLGSKQRPCHSLGGFNVAVRREAMQAWFNCDSTHCRSHKEMRCQN